MSNKFNTDMRQNNKGLGYVDMLGKPVKVCNDGNKKCKFRGCKVIISIYNPNKYCYQHNRKIVNDKVRR
jgi:hypothetical protein